MKILNEYLENYDNFDENEWYKNENIHQLFSLYKKNTEINARMQIPDNYDLLIIEESLKILNERIFKTIFSNEKFLILSFYLSWKKYDVNNLNKLLKNNKNKNFYRIFLFDLNDEDKRKIIEELNNIKIQIKKKEQNMTKFTIKTS